MKTSQLERAIAQLEGEKAVLELALVKLRQQQTQKIARPRKRTAALANMPMKEHLG